MTVVVGLLLLVLGLLVGAAMAFLFARYMRWVRRHHPGHVVRVWRALFLFPLLLVMVATIQAAGLSATSASDTDQRFLVLAGLIAGFFGTPLVYWLQRRRRAPDYHANSREASEPDPPTAEDVRKSQMALRRMKILAIALLIPITGTLFFIAFNTPNAVASTGLLLAIITVCAGIWQFTRRR